MPRSRSATLAVLLIVGGCANPGGTTSVPVPETPPIPATTTPQSFAADYSVSPLGTGIVVRDGGVPSARTLQAVTLIRREVYDRVVFQFGPGAVPELEVRYASGLSLPGESTVAVGEVLAVTFAADDTTVFGDPGVIPAPTLNVVRAVLAGDQDGLATWALELKQRTPFRVLTWPNPARIVVDVFHRRP